MVAGVFPLLDDAGNRVVKRLANSAVRSLLDWDNHAHSKVIFETKELISQLASESVWLVIALP